jgi:hypothetical protein
MDVYVSATAYTVYEKDGSVNHHDPENPASHYLIKTRFTDGKWWIASFYVVRQG